MEARERARLLIVVGVVGVLALGAWLALRSGEPAEALSTTGGSTAEPEAALRTPHDSDDGRAAVPPEQVGPVALADPPSDEAELLVSVVWASSGLPAAGIGLSVRQEQRYLSPRAARTDAQGRYRQPGFALGSVEVRLDRGLSTEYSVDRIGLIELTLELSDSRSIRGVVRTRDGVPVAGARILLGSANYTRPDQVVARSGGDGTFSFEGSSPGRRVSAVHERLGASEAVALHDGMEELELVLAPHATARITGRVEREDGQPVRRAQVVVLERGPTRELLVVLREGHVLTGGSRAPTATAVPRGWRSAFRPRR